jgi:hypothetical protein
MFMRKCKLSATWLLVCSTIVSNAQVHQAWKMQPVGIQTRWAKEVTPANVLPEYPRPQMVRNNNWQNLNGLWEYIITPLDVPKPKMYEGKILVPFPVESALSGVKKALMPNQILWYKRNFSAPNLLNGERLILNFGAVDWEATIFINGKELGNHRGGYTAFAFDVTNYLKNGENEILVKVFDPTDQGVNPHGKQSLSPGNIYYTPISGIWQTVWLEVVPSTRINHVIISTNIDNSSTVMSLSTLGDIEGVSAKVNIKVNGKIIFSNSGPVNSSFVYKIANMRLWSPEDPFLYDVDVTLIKGSTVIDNVSTYFGMRKVNVQKDKNGVSRIFLNNSPYFNLGVLDQGYWPDGLYTAPTDEALRFDIQAVKELGFNTIRKHIKVEPARWYYHADKIGVLVWQDFVNPPHNLKEGSKNAFEREVVETVSQLSDFACISSWIIFNETWGSYDQLRISDLIRDIDPGRLINAHSGEMLYVNNESRYHPSSPYLGSDVTDVHSYPYPKLPMKMPEKAMVCGEFGGISLGIPNHQFNDLTSWGYMNVSNVDLNKVYSNMVDTLLVLKSIGLSASIFTQPVDVETEENGFLTYDRKVLKVDPQLVRSLNGSLIDKHSSDHSNIFLNIGKSNKIFSEFSPDNLQKKFEFRTADSMDMRRLILLSFQGDGITKLPAMEKYYFQLLKSPFKQSNFDFLSFITKSINDFSFEYLIRNRETFNVQLGNSVVDNKIADIVLVSLVRPFISRGKLDSLNYYADFLDKKFGSLVLEKFYGELMVYFLDNSEWERFGEYYLFYFSKIGDRSEFHINNMSYYVFLHINDTKTLSFSANVMKRLIEKSMSADPDAVDTYANLLYKIGDTKNAILQEERAISLSDDKDRFQKVLDKMVAGQPTWN